MSIVDVATDDVLTAQNAPAAAPINKGVDDRVYADQREAHFIGASSYIDTADSIVRDYEGMWSPFFQAGSIDTRAKDLAAKMAADSGRPNVLYIEDRYGASASSTVSPSQTLRDDSPAVGTIAQGHVAGDQSDFLSGDPTANLDAALSDLKSSAEDVAKVGGFGLGMVALVIVAVLLSR